MKFRTLCLFALLIAGACTQTSGQYQLDSHEAVPQIRPGADDSGNCDPARHLQGYC